MKVAICIFGQPRWINNPYVLLSHKYWIIDRYKADVFIHSWISGEEKKFDYADQVEEYKKTKEVKNVADIIIKKYNPKKYIFEKPKDFSLDEKSRTILKKREQEYYEKVNGYFNHTLTNENNHLSQLYSMSKSISLLNDDYDWIILSRFDNYIYNFPNLFILEKNNLYLNDTYSYNFADVLIFGGQKQIETLNCFDLIPELCNKILYFTPEEFKRTAYQRIYNLDPPQIGEYLYEIGQEKRIPIGVGVVRSNTLENLQI